ncbi:MAG: hypothetical protein ICV83_23060, partial [Cytophagales bacterium]|nr:hypothetical protein [Cytophagales bacterium]
YLFYKATLLLRNNNSGFLYGALGIVHYFVERLPDLRIENYLLSILPLLFNTLTTQFSTAAQEFASIELNMASGIPGILLVLIKAHQKGMHDNEIKKTVREQILKIISYRADLDFSQKRYSIFPEAVDKKSGDRLFGNALAWSSGDLNQSLLFYQANAMFGDLDLKRMGDLVGLNTLLRRDEATTHITGSDFFSGSSGLAQVYHHMAEVTQRKAYREGSVFWINKTVEFLARELPAGTYDGREMDVLHGLAGVALTLLTYRHGVKWSHCVLL